ncbi:MAG: hypothetical protein HQL42_16465 [Alphaproteobacteria bacterium]|nr:hypothetical protein [Alphaproteobacteria bacterium]
MIDTIRRALRAETDRLEKMRGVTVAEALEEVREDLVKLMAAGASLDDAVAFLTKLGVPAVTKTTLRLHLRRPKAQVAPLSLAPPGHGRGVILPAGGLEDADPDVGGAEVEVGDASVEGDDQGDDEEGGEVEEVMPVVAPASTGGSMGGAAPGGGGGAVPTMPFGAAGWPARPEGGGAR